MKQFPLFSAGAAVLMLLLGHTAFAATDDLPPLPAWSGTVQMGYTGTAGNTQETNFNNKLNAVYDKNQWTDNVHLESLFASNKTNTTAERYASTLEFNFNFSATNFMFYRSSSIYDKFNAYDLNFSNVVGYGRRIFNHQKVTIDLQAGPGERVTRINGTLTYIDDYVTFVGGALNWQISDNASLQQTINTEIGTQNTFTQSETDLTTNIVGNLGLQISFAINHNGVIPTGSNNTANTDYRTEVDLLYSF